MLAYIHIPFCDSKCHYCSFNSYVDKFELKLAYMQALYTQLAHELKRFNATPKSIETLFIGGGTPSTIEPKLYEPILKLLTPYLQEGAEITTEANPNSATLTWLEGMKKLGVNRISLGVQSFNEVKLKALGRAHSSTQAKDAVKNASRVGFEHISLDLIYNYQGDTKKLIEYDINQAFELPIDHLSAYELTIEEHTKFHTTPEVKQENDTLAHFVANNIIQKGFTHYEISNFGAYQSAHNLGYWQQKYYLGAGAGAVGFLKNKRFYPVSNIEAYIQNPLNINEELLSTTDLLTEAILLGLRSQVGIEKSILSETMFTRADTLVNEQKLHQTATHFYSANYFVADALALYLLD